MTAPTALRGALMVVTAVSLAAAARFATAGAPVEAAATAEPFEVPAARGTEAASAAPGLADSLAQAITRRNPFRIHRSPAAVRFAPELAGQPLPPPPPVARANLVLAGVVLGPEPVALIDGLPGTDGTRALRLGERHGDYRLRELSAERAVIAGPDTTYVLPVRSRYP